MKSSKNTVETSPSCLASGSASTTTQAARWLLCTLYLGVEKNIGTWAGFKILKKKERMRAKKPGQNGQHMPTPIVNTTLIPFLDGSRQVYRRTWDLLRSQNPKHKLCSHPGRAAIFINRLGAQGKCNQPQAWNKWEKGWPIDMPVSPGSVILHETFWYASQVTSLGGSKNYKHI